MPINHSTKATISNVRLGSTSDLQSDGQLVGDAGQVVQGAWSAVLAMIGQQAGNLQKLTRTANANAHQTRASKRNVRSIGKVLS